MNQRSGRETAISERTSDGLTVCQSPDGVTRQEPAAWPILREMATQSSYELYGMRVLECTREGKRLRIDHDAVDLIGDALGIGARMIVIPVERFDADFFRLRTRIAGEIVQKFVQYRRHLVILGDISAHVAASSAFAAFVNEANVGRNIWFVADRAELERRLEQRRI